MGRDERVAGCTSITWNSCENTNPWALPVDTPSQQDFLEDPESVFLTSVGWVRFLLCGGFGTLDLYIPSRTHQVDASLCCAGEGLTFTHTHPPKNRP